MSTGSSILLVNAGFVAGLTTITLLVGGSANAPSMGATRMARLAAKAAAIPVAANRRLLALSSFAAVCARILPWFVKTVAISVSPSSLVPPATMVGGEDEAGGAVFLRDVATQWGE